MAIGTYLVLSLVASAVQGIWQGCRNAWGENPVRGYRLERELAKLDQATSELTHGMTEEEYYLSMDVEGLSRRHDQLMIALCLNKGLDPFSGGIAQMYWNGRLHTQKRREELLNPKPLPTAQDVADALYARLHPQITAPGLPRVASAHRCAIGMSRRLALPPAR